MNKKTKKGLYILSAVVTAVATGNYFSLVGVIFG